MNVTIHTVSTSKFFETLRSINTPPSMIAFRNLRRQHRISLAAISDLSGYHLRDIGKFDKPNQANIPRPNIHMERDLWEALERLLPKVKVMKAA